MRILSVVLAALAAIVLLGGSVITEWHNPAVPGATGYAALYEVDPNGGARGVMELGWYEGQDSTVMQLFAGEWQIAVHENDRWTFPLQGDADGMLILGDLHVTGRLYLDGGYLENVDGALIWCAMDTCEE